MDVLDAFRFCIGIYTAQLLCCVNAFPPKRRFGISIAAGFLAAAASALLYLPLVQGTAGAGYAVKIMMRLIYWTGMTFLMCLMVKINFEVTAGDALFRGLIASGLQGICMAVSKYMVVHMWFPGIAERHFTGYVVLTVMVYALLYSAAWRMLMVRMQTSSGLKESEDRRAFWFLCFFYLTFFFVVYTTEYIFEELWQETQGMESIHRTLGIFITAVLVLLNVLPVGIQYYIYEMAVLRNERNVFARLMEEKRLQYEFSKENIEIVNRKCHDLKHQLLALEAADGSERRKMIEETKKSVEIYDSVVRTGNEVLDVLLTEKSVLCARRGIRFSCMVRVERLGDIGIIDLYTMLGNAMDNAMECVEQFADKEKKVISLNAETKGKMLCFSVENYYEGEIVLFRGIPATSKKDKENHGIGVRSIQRLAQSYGGDIRINLQNHIFVLQIAVPLSKK